MKTRKGLSFEDNDQESIVYLDAKKAGTIRCRSYGSGWFYQPKGSMTVGETMPTRGAVKESLREPS